MAIYELQADKIVRVPDTRFDGEGVRERGDLQRILRTNIEVVSPDTLIIAEEFGQWQDSKRRIDLLGLDKSANLVVIELKRTEDGGHMELQAIRYAAMISTMTFQHAVNALSEFQRRQGIEADAQQTILDFLEWSEPDEEQFGQAVRIVLVSADFSKELTTAVMWLNNFDLDIRCVRLKPYILNGQRLLDVQQVIPLPEAAEYQVQVKEKSQKERSARKWNMDFTRYDLSVGGKVYPMQWKRRAALLAARAIIETGASPEEIDEVASFSRGTLWWKAPGELDSEQFVQRAMQDAPSVGRVFKRTRWFVEDEELVHVNGETYAFTNQWGSDWPDVMKALAEKYPELEITLTPAKATDHG